MACVIITGAKRSCPTAALEVSLNLAPLHLVVEQAAKVASVRMVRNEAAGNKSLRDILMFGQEHLLDLSMDSLIRKYNFEISFHTELSIKKGLREIRHSLPLFEER